MSGGQTGCRDTIKLATRLSRRRPNSFPRKAQFRRLQYLFDFLPASTRVQSQFRVQRPVQVQKLRELNGDHCLPQRGVPVREQKRNAVLLCVRILLNAHRIAAWRCTGGRHWEVFMRGSRPRCVGRGRRSHDARQSVIFESFHEMDRCLVRSNVPSGCGSGQELLRMREMPYRK